jgi:hypothetical protein
MTSIIHFLALLVSLWITGMVAGSSTPNPLIDDGKWIFHSFHVSFGLYWKEGLDHDYLHFLLDCKFDSKIDRKKVYPIQVWIGSYLDWKHILTFIIWKFLRNVTSWFYLLLIYQPPLLMSRLKWKDIFFGRYSKAQLHNTRVRNCAFVKKKKTGAVRCW